MMRYIETKILLWHFKSHEEGLSSELRNRKFLRTKGEVPDDRLSEHIELMTVIERQNAIVKKLAFYLDATFPTLRELPPGWCEL